MINQNKDAYRHDAEYNMDNEISQHYYPKRIIEIINNEIEGIELGECSLLELGLGHAYTVDVFSKYFDDYTILDGDSRIIELHQNKVPKKIKIIETMFEEYTTTSKYDFIIAGFVLEHIDDPIMVLKKYSKMLKAGGKIFITVPNAESLNRRVGYYAGLLPDMKLFNKHDIEVGHIRYYNLEEITKDCENAGLKVIRQEGIYLKPLTEGQMRSLRLSDSILEGFCRVGQQYPELSLSILIECEV